MGVEVVVVGEKGSRGNGQRLSFGQARHKIVIVINDPRQEGKMEAETKTWLVEVTQPVAHRKGWQAVRK